jgi:hypothetical protein
LGTPKRKNQEGKIMFLWEKALKMSKWSLAVVGRGRYKEGIRKG